MNKVIFEKDYDLLNDISDVYRDLEEAIDNKPEDLNEFGGLIRIKIEYINSNNQDFC